MSTTSTSRPSAEGISDATSETGTDWAAIDAMTDEQAFAAARADPDAQPATEAQLARARRVGLGGAIRFRLGLSLADFEARYDIPAATLWAWERGTASPDAAMLSYLTLIDADPAGIAETLRRARLSTAA